MNPARLLTPPRPKLPPRYRFSAAGHLERSTDGGHTWHEVVPLEPGYRYLRLWRVGDETRLRVEYDDHPVEMSSAEWDE
ncbi:MAG: hypothetical protein RMK99_04670 [Anaerolineales bacterium]|nr:hypothetical protein [Anaerolineales bacterium]